MEGSNVLQQTDNSTNYSTSQWGVHIKLFIQSLNPNNYRAMTVHAKDTLEDFGTGGKATNPIKKNWIVIYHELHDKNLRACDALWEAPKDQPVDIQRVFEKSVIAVHRCI